MSAADHIEGFTELLEVSGVELWLEGVGITALVEREGVDAQPFDLAPGDCQSVVIKCLKTAIREVYVSADETPYTDPAGNYYLSDIRYLPPIGSYFLDEDGGQYRIKGRVPMPGKPISRILCEYAGSDE